MARYTAKKRETELSEFQERALLALHAISMECERCLSVPPGGVGGIYSPGRAIAKAMGGKWTSWRHKEMLKLRDMTWIDANLGFERGSSLKQVWRYSLTEAGRAEMLNRMAGVNRECIWINGNPDQLELFAEAS